MSEELEKRQAEIKNLEVKRDKLEEEIKEKKRHQGQQNRELTKIEEQIKDYELKLSKKRPQFIKAKESSSHLIKKLDTSKVCYESALKLHETHLSQIKTIEADLDKLKKERDEFEKEIEKESLSQGISMELRESQMKTYQRLKEESARRTGQCQEQLDGLLREQKLDQDSLDNEMRKRNDAEAKIKQKQYELEEQRAKLTKLVEYINSTDSQINQQIEIEKVMGQEIETAKVQCKELENELGKIMNDIGDARIDKFESSRSQKKAEIIEQLKKKFSGVHGRLIDHCEPVHRKYQVAITKVMGKSMDAIVVDTEKTARECIKFMKEQHLQSETFYPLDYIDVTPLDERLREIREPRNTKMLIDVIKFNPPAIKKALQFAVGNCLVCESDEDARTLAFATERNKVVSFDGTLFQKSGLISGGSSELKQKAKRWDEKHLDLLRKKKEDLSEQLKEQLKIRRKEPELIDLRSNIKGLEYRLRYSKQNKDLAEQKTVVNLEKELQQFKQENSRYDPKIKEIEARLHDRAARIKNLKTDSNKIEDEIFGDFCREINVDNIRVYEERELAGQQEHVKERMLFEEKKTRLITQLEFEKSRDTLKSYQKWQREMEECNKELNKLKQEEETLVQSIKQIEEQIEAKKSETEKYRNVADEIENEMNELKKKMSIRNKEINDFRKKINSIEARLLDKRLERHAILKNAKIELIELPMLRGSMNDINEEDPNTQTQRTNSEDASTGISNTTGTNIDSLNTVSTADQAIMFEKEAHIKINYKQLDTDFLNVSYSL